MSSKDSLFRAVLKERLRTALMVSGMASFLAGLLCMPIPLVNPEAMTSLFAVFAAGGLVVRYGGALLILGVVLFCAAAFVPRGK
jgi:hypothetical protein